MLPVWLASTRRTRGGRIHKRRGRGGGRTRLPPPQRTRHDQVRGNQRRPLNLGDDLTEDILVKKARTRARSHSEQPTLSLRHWNGGVHKEALTTLSPHEGGTSRRRTGLLRQRRRHGGQGRVEDRWVRRLKAISLQHGEYSGHQPERRGRHLQLSPEQTLHPLHLRIGNGAPMLRPHGPGPNELRKGGIHQQRGGEQGIVRNSIATRTSRDDVGERFGPASKSLCTSSNLRLYLRDSGIKPEALSGSRRLWLAEPGLKPAARRMRSVRRRTSIGADLINEVSQTRRCGVSEGDIALYITGLRLRRRTGVTS